MSRIEELEKRLAADPNSRIFVQLAEEYRKQGLLENAIEVCEEGLKKHPQYPSARVALGRALLEAESFDRASEEFETVLAQVPDNILANKFLGETYHRLGRFDEAIQKYQIAQTLAPEDTELEDKIQAVKADMAGGPPPPPAASEPADETVMAPPQTAGTPPGPPPVPPPPPAGETLEPTLVDAQAQSPGTEVPPVPPPVPRDAAPPEAPEAVSETEEEKAPEPDLAPIPLVDVSEPMVLEGPAYSAAGKTADETQAPEPPPPPPPDIVSPFEPAPQQEQIFEAEPAAEPELVSPFEAVQEGERTFEAPMTEPEVQPPPPPVPPAPPAPEVVTAEIPQPAPIEPTLEPSPPVPGEIETPTMAELYANQGHFERAVAVYRNLLARNPNETQYAQRIEELEMLASATAAPASTPPAAGRDAHGDDRARQKTIEVLEQWLEAIRGSRRT